MVDIQTLFGYLTPISLTIGVIYHVMMLRNAQKSRQTQMLMQLYHKRNDKDNIQRFWRLMALDWEDFDDYMEKYGPIKNPEEEETRAIVAAEWAFYDGLGMLLKEKMVDVNTMHTMFGLRCLMIWYKHETLVKGIRMMSGLGGGSDYAEDFEYLADEMIKIRTQRGLPLPVEWLHPTSSLHPGLKT